MVDSGTSSEKPWFPLSMVEWLSVGGTLAVALFAVAGSMNSARTQERDLIEFKQEVKVWMRAAEERERARQSQIDQLIAIVDREVRPRP